MKQEDQRKEPFPFPWKKYVYGEIERWREVKPMIYHVVTLDEYTRSRYYVIPTDYTGDIITPDVLRRGIEEDGIQILEERDGYWPVEYELLLDQKRKASGEERDRLDKAILEVWKRGRRHSDCYFGPSFPPSRTPAGVVTRFKEVTDGVWLLDCSGTWFLTMDRVFYSNLSSLAQELSYQGEDDWAIWDEAHCAPAIYELLDRYGLTEVSRFITCEEDLLGCLRARHPEYVRDLDMGLDLLEKLREEHGVCPGKRYPRLDADGPKADTFLAPIRPRR